MKNEKKYLPEHWRMADPEPGEWHSRKNGSGYGLRRGSRLAEREYWTPATKYITQAKRGQPMKYKITMLEPGRYYVSTHGRIYDSKRDVVMRYSKHCRSHQRLHTADGKTIIVRAYRLVLDNFLQIQDQYGSLIYNLCLEANHLDGKAWRDFLDNIEYTTHGENMIHSWSFRERDEDTLAN